MTTLIDSLRSALARARATRATRTLSPYWSAVEAIAAGDDVNVHDQKLLDAMLDAGKEPDDIETDVALLGELRQAEASAAEAPKLEKQAPAVAKAAAELRQRSEELLAESKRLFEEANAKVRAQQNARQAATDADLRAKNIRAQLAARGHTAFAGQVTAEREQLQRETRAAELRRRIGEIEGLIAESEQQIANDLELPLGRESKLALQAGIAQRRRQIAALEQELAEVS